MIDSRSDTTTRRRAAAVVIAAALLWAPVTIGLADPASADPGVDRVNRLRDVAGLPPVVKDPRLAEAAAHHARYTVATRRVGHVQDPSHELASALGAASAARSNVALRYSPAGPLGWPRMIDHLQVAPFHGLLHLQPGLVASGSGHHRNGAWEATVVDVRAGVDTRLPPATGPVRFPGPGATSHLRQYGGGEHPDPLAPCAGWQPPTGAPVTVLVHDERSITGVDVVGPDGRRLEVCWYDAGRYRNPDPEQERLGRAVLAEQRGLVALPRRPLATGRHTVAVTAADAPAMTWSFAVGASAVGASARVPLAPPLDPRVEPVCAADGLATSPFRDVPRTTHAHAIGCAASIGLVAGTSTVTFTPGRTTTRAQAATLVQRFLDHLGAPPTVPAGPGFPDIPLDHPHRDAIDALAAAGVLQGRGERFDPDDAVTRAQLASLLSRALDEVVGPAAATGSSRFPDVEVDSPHLAAIERLAALDVLTGTTDGRFHPGRPVTRAQAAAVLVRTVAAVEDLGGPD